MKTDAKYEAVSRVYGQWRATCTINGEFCQSYYPTKREAQIAQHKMRKQARSPLLTNTTKKRNAKSQDLPIGYSEQKPRLVDGKWRNGSIMFTFTHKPTSQKIRFCRTYGRLFRGVVDGERKYEIVTRAQALSAVADLVAAAEAEYLAERA